MILVFPPGARSTEPPPGIARLAGFLRRNGLEACPLDLNQEALEWFLGPAAEGSPALKPRDARALGNRRRNAESLWSYPAYQSIDRYKRAVLELSHSLKILSAPYGAEFGLADYREESRSPLRKADLRAAAADWEHCLFRSLFEERIGAAIKDGREPAILGISLSFLGQALPAFALVGLVRARWPATRIILGGGLVSSWIAQGSLAADEAFGGLVDALLPGPGEVSLSAWLGLSTPILDGPAVFDDFLGLRYLAPGRIIPYNFSSGCPWKRCSFCPEKAEDSRYRGTRHETATMELHSLVAQYGPTLLHITDNEISPLYLRALANDPPGVPWYGFARFTALLGDRAFAGRLAASGCVMLQLGLESGDQAVLDALDKGINLTMIDHALEALADAGIAVYLYALFGTPAEDRDAAFRTRDFLASRADRVAFLNNAVFNMPISGQEARMLSTKPFYEGELALYCEFAHPRGWNRPEVRRFLAGDLARTPEIAAILARNPPLLTSSHAAFFLEGMRLPSVAPKAGRDRTHG
ncbi:MAG: B12-binding domain-containing radical SAM protein [Rectinemataceae bacterium]